MQGVCFQVTNQFGIDPSGLQHIPAALQCWIASLSLSPPAASLRSLTCCKIGLTLYHHTSNIEEAKAYVNQAVSVLTLVEGTLYMWIIYLSHVMTCTQIHARFKSRSSLISMLSEQYNV